LEIQTTIKKQKTEKQKREREAYLLAVAAHQH
jgi:hypothetical protein